VCVGARLFHHGADWLLERTIGTDVNGVSCGLHLFSDLSNFADNVALHAELRKLLVSALEMMASDAASLGLEVNWQKTKVQALNSREDAPSTIKVQGQEVAVEFFSWLPSTQQLKSLPISRVAITAPLQVLVWLAVHFLPCYSTHL